MLNDHFAHRAADWDQPSKIEMSNRFVEELKKNIDLQPNWKALEVGAGTGLVGLAILPEVNSVVFEDTSPAMLGVLRSKLNGDEKIETVEGEIFDYQKQDIHLVFSLMAFHHLPDIDKALEYLANITLPGAYVVVGDLMSEDGSFHRFEPIPHQGFDPETLNQQFADAGFEVERNYVYDTLMRERIPGVMSGYEQFILVARRTQNA
jgi:ubiquinone/menaquinone biosynthesis C-methylase UbiE